MITRFRQVFTELSTEFVGKNRKFFNRSKVLSLIDADVLGMACANPREQV